MYIPQMKTIVVTGATRGIGKGLATEFLRRGHQVFICGRNPDSLAAALEDLASIDPDRAGGHVADMSVMEDVRALWSAATDRFGAVDIWINNAGLGAVRAKFHHRSPDQVRTLVNTNVVGLMFGSMVAFEGMEKQGHGLIMNMEGLGSRGPVIAGSALYGASKAAVTRYTAAVIKDAQNGPVHVGYVSPGMVITDLFTGPNMEEMTPSFRKLSNILADRVETVTPWLAERILAVRRNGARVDWLPGWKVAARFLTAPFRRGRIFPEN
jgi:NAD(P)-dependent dehydrogenase (short-subunit alcohol dehydrogenase family)